MRTFLIAIAIALALPGAALASARDVLRDCGDDEHLSKTYTQKEYRDALSQLSADANEYTNCRAVIRRAQLAAAGAGGTKSGATKTTPSSSDTKTTTTPEAAATPGGPTPQEQADLNAATSKPGGPVALDGGTVNATKSSGISSLPTPVIVLLALLLVAALGFGAFRIRGLVGRRS